MLVGKNSLDFTVWKQESTRRSERIRTNNAGTKSKSVTTNSATHTRKSIPAYYNSIAEERLCGSVRSLPVIRAVSGQYQVLRVFQFKHCGPQALLANTRQQFWTIKGKQVALTTVRRCITCCRARPRLLNQIMSPGTNNKTV